VATYTVKTLITTKALGSGPSNVATWQYQNTGSAEAVCRSFAFMGNTGTSNSITVEMGVTGVTSIVTQRIIDGFSLTANIPYFVNGWYTIPVNSFLSGFAATNATTNGLASGVTSV